MFQRMECNVELIIRFFIDFVKHVIHHGNTKNRHKTQVTVSIWEADHNKVNGIPNIPQSMVTKELSIPLRKVTDKMLGSSDAGDNVLRLLQITQIQNFQSFTF